MDKKTFLKWQLFKMKNSLKEFLADGVKISSLTEANWNAFFLKSKKKKKKP